MHAFKYLPNIKICHGSNHLTMNHYTYYALKFPPGTLWLLYCNGWDERALMGRQPCSSWLILSLRKEAEAENRITWNHDFKGLMFQWHHTFSLIREIIWNNCQTKLLTFSKLYFCHFSLIQLLLFVYFEIHFRHLFNRHQDTKQTIKKGR